MDSYQRRSFVDLDVQNPCPSLEKAIVNFSHAHPKFPSFY
jgi:hypothetical protein